MQFVIWFAIFCFSDQYQCQISVFVPFYVYFATLNLRSRSECCGGKKKCFFSAAAAAAEKKMFFFRCGRCSGKKTFSSTPLISGLPVWEEKKAVLYTPAALHSAGLKTTNCESNFFLKRSFYRAYSWDEARKTDISPQILGVCLKTVIHNFIPYWLLTPIF